jgi:pilus assembly protein CpaF
MRAHEGTPTLPDLAGDVAQALATRHPDLLRFLVWTPERIQQLTTAVDAELATREVEPPELKALVRRSVVNQVTGLGPLDEVLLDESVTEILVNRHDDMWVERNGQLMPIPSVFLDDAEVQRLAQRLAARVGKSLTTESPMVDARLSDGSRIAAVLPPVSQHPTIAIRRAQERPPTWDDLLQAGSITEDAMEFLRSCVRGRANMVIAGGAGTGKTHLLRLLAGDIPAAERVVTIEDVAELALGRPGLVALETAGRYGVHDLFVQALRLRPDRILVGEVRGGEALDLIEAMQSGHPGTLSTVHSPGPGWATLHRIARAAMRNVVTIPYQAVLEEVARAVHIVVFLRRETSGLRRVVHIDRIVDGVVEEVFRPERSMLVRVGDG